MNCVSIFHLLVNTGSECLVVFQTASVAEQFVLRRDCIIAAGENHQGAEKEGDTTVHAIPVLHYKA